MWLALGIVVALIILVVSNINVIEINLDDKVEYRDEKDDNNNPSNF